MWLFSLILENARPFSNATSTPAESRASHPPQSKTSRELKGFRGSRGCRPSGATYTTSGRRQRLPTGHTSTLLYFSGGMKARVLFRQRQLRLPLASRIAGGAHASPQNPLPPPEPSLGNASPSTSQQDHPPQSGKASPASPGWWDSSSSPSSRAARTAMPAQPRPRSTPLFELGNRRSEAAREAPGSPWFCPTPLPAEFATLPIKRGLGLGRGPGFPKAALLSPSSLCRFLQLCS